MEASTQQVARQALALGGLLGQQDRKGYLPATLEAQGLAADLHRHMRSTAVRR